MASAETRLPPDKGIRKELRAKKKLEFQKLLSYKLSYPEGE